MINRLPLQDTQEIIIPYPTSYGLAVRRSLTIQRNKLLQYLNESRSDRETYKRYLLLTLDGSDFVDIFRGIKKTILTKLIPDWVLEEVDAGREVDIFVVFKYMGTRYIQHDVRGTSRIFKLSKNMLRNSESISEYVQKNEAAVMNGSVCAKAKISKIIKSSVDEEGNYSKEIEEISKINNISEDNLQKYGWSKPIFSIEFKNFTLFPVNIMCSAQIFMTKFEVIETPIEIYSEKKIRSLNRMTVSAFSLTPTEVPSPIGFRNMGTVWF